MSDLIDRAEAIRIASGYCHPANIAEELRKLPAAVQPERKIGEWLTSDDMYETGICSCCRYDTQEPVSYVITNFEYCPNCGAKMEEGE